MNPDEIIDGLFAEVETLIAQRLEIDTHITAIKDRIKSLVRQQNQAEGNGGGNPPQM